MKKKAPRHYAHVAHAMHHHHVKYFPKVFYHKGSLFPIIVWKSLFLLLICSLFIYFLLYNLKSQVSIFPNQQVVENQKMLFSLEGTPEDRGVDPMLLNTHGAAANEFDFLFTETGQTNQEVSSTTDSLNDSSSDDQTVSDTLWVETWFSSQNTSGTVSQGIDLAIDQNLALNIELVQSLIQTSLVAPDSNLSLWTSHVGASDISLELIDSESNTTSSSVLPIEPSASCKTPWWQIIPHKDFILAYKQRTDVNSLCNVQKRYCFNGKLTGSYTQDSCKEDMKYTYQEVVPVAQNDPNVEDPFIQPTAPALSGATFDVHGKIDTTLKATDERSNSGDPLIDSTWLYINHISSTWSFCKTPWWEEIPNGQFVKAYKLPVWLIDMPCQVEIRLCGASILKWSFKYSTCLAKNMTYSDYVLDRWENSDTPNTTDMLNAVMTDSQKNSSPTAWFWAWLTKRIK